MFLLKGSKQQKTLLKQESLQWKEQPEVIRFLTPASCSLYVLVIGLFNCLFNISVQ